MNAKEINHASGLARSLAKKAGLLEQQSDDLSSEKDGNSPYAVALLRQAADCRSRAADLNNAIAVALFIG